MDGTCLLLCNFRARMLPVNSFVVAAWSVDMAFWFFLGCKPNRSNRMLLGTLFLFLAAFGGPARAEAADGTVRVLYPDGLAGVMQHGIAPAFEQATGDQFAGDHATSIKLAGEIRKKTQAADVLISANPQSNLQLMGLSQGDWVDWYAMFMQSPLVVGYDTASKFDAELKSRPWF
ncbi:MAG: substrate-binding domain-containing protein, partial [Salinisphaera sp.]|nr:substrate-binding domain-containing protein [Salinisphaera sp.]